MTKHRTLVTGIRMDEIGIHIVIAVSDENRSSNIVISGSEASDLIHKLRFHMDEIMTKSKWWSPEDWKCQTSD